MKPNRVFGWLMLILANVTVLLTLTDVAERRYDKATFHLLMGYSFVFAWWVSRSERRP